MYLSYDVAEGGEETIQLFLGIGDMGGSVVSIPVWWALSIHSISSLFSLHYSLKHSEENSLPPPPHTPPPHTTHTLRALFAVGLGDDYHTTTHTPRFRDHLPYPPGMAFGWDIATRLPFLFIISQPHCGVYTVLSP